MPTPAPQPVPDGMHTVTMQLFFDGEAKELAEGQAAWLASMAGGGE